MATNRTVNSPDDIFNYPEFQIAYRKFERPPQYRAGWVIECEWAEELEDDGVTVKHPAEAVSFAETADGWDKINAMRLD